MKKEMLKLIIKGLIITFIIILAGLLFGPFLNEKSHSIFEGSYCDVTLEFNQITDCSKECVPNCISEGFPKNIEHTLTERIFVLDSTKKSVVCVCDCNGCRE